MNWIRLSLAFLLAQFLAITSAKAATYYIAADGNDSASGTSGAPWATFERAFDEGRATRVTGGDTLVVKDGTYAQGLRDIPSGSDGAYTTVKAEHDFRVTITGTTSDSQSLYVNGHHIQIEGMRFDGQQVRNSAVIAYANHVKVLRSAFSGAPCEDNTTVVSAGPDSSDLLFEDSWAFGCGRYKFTVYQSQRVVFRRCVSRHDYHHFDPQGYNDNQCAPFTTYDSNDVLYENCIALDSGQDPAKFGNVVGGLWYAQDNHVLNNVTVLGSIFLNLETMVFGDPVVYGAHVIRDSVVWHSHGGSQFANVYDDWRNPEYSPSLTVDHVTMGDLYGTPLDATPAGGIGFTGYPGLSDFPAAITNSLLYQCKAYGLGTDIQSDYNDFWGNGQDHGPGGHGKGPHDMRADPEIEYIVRAEPDSPLKGAAGDGGYVGATILQRYGKSGTLWGEDGYDKLQPDPLWPFPNEAEIKTDMSSWTGPNDGKRGFCADGSGRYGGPITLTSYIWEYLGNACPSEICGTATHQAPATPTGLAAAAGDRQVTLSWTANGEKDLCGYKVYMAASAGGAYSAVGPSLVSGTSYAATGLTGSTTYYFEISAVNAYGDESALTAPVSATPTGTGGGGTSGAGGSGGSGGCSASTDTGSWLAVLPCLVLLALLRSRRHPRTPAPARAHVAVGRR